MRPNFNALLMKSSLNPKKLSIAALAIVSMLPLPLSAEESIDQRIARLERLMQEMSGELTELKQARDAEAARADSAEAQLQEVKATQDALLAEVADKLGGAEAEGPSLPAGLSLGAYGEHHFNFSETSGGNRSDIHRFVAFLGYEFNDWLSFTSETELEHAFVAPGAGGEVVLEQFYFDMLIDPAFNLRFGRALHPAGIINRLHEPTAFYGVERPSFSANILPSTWSIDGIGAFGSITEWLSYEVYLHAGLDGSALTGGSGIRSGRIKERPGLEDFGVSSRMDILPLGAAGIESDVSWRLGASYSYVGLENSNNGSAAGGNPAEGGVHIISMDTDISYGNFEFRGEWAQLNLTDAEAWATPAETISGWYVQGAYHIIPVGMFSGRWETSNLVGFVRYSDLNPQDEVPSTGTLTPTNNQQEVTFGLSYYPVSNLVFKADYTFVDSDGGNRPNRTDLGIGYAF